MRKAAATACCTRPSVGEPVVVPLGPTSVWVLPAPGAPYTSTAESIPCSIASTAGETRNATLLRLHRRQGSCGAPVGPWRAPRGCTAAWKTSRWLDCSSKTASNS